MTQALEYLYYIYQKFITLVFTQLNIFNGVNIGWIIITISLFGLLIRSVLNLPKGITVKRKDGK